MTKMNGYDIYGGVSGGASLKGIVKFEKNEQGIVGLEIPDLLSINNYKVDATGTEVLPTNGNLCLRDYTADLLRADNPNIIELTYWKKITLDTQEFKAYKDPKELVYLRGDIKYPEGGVLYDQIFFIGNEDGGITVAPEWTSESEFKCSDDGQLKALHHIQVLNFTVENTSMIHVPKYIVYFRTMMNNFSGTIDLTSCVYLDTSTVFDVSNVKNCTNGTLLLNATQYTALSSRISEGMLEGKIKVQQKVESEGGGES